MSPSYGYSYLTSYGWTGTGAGLRNGAIAKPVAIPPKKNLSGLGKDRDDAFPFWDHLFTAAAKAITIKVSSDDEDADKSKDLTDQPSISLTRTTTGILSNRPPILGTPASTSGSTTPSLNTDVDILNTGVAGRPSLLAIAKREAAKRGLYARFFRGPVLGPDDSSHLVSSSSQSSSVFTPVPKLVAERENVVGNEKRKSEDKEETREERRERKKIKRERKVAKAAKRAAKALAGDKVDSKKDRKARKKWCEKTCSEESRLRKTARSQCAASAQGDLEQAKCTRDGLQKGRTPTADGRQDTSSHTPSNVVNEAGALNVVLTTKKKGKRKNTPS